MREKGSLKPLAHGGRSDGELQESHCGGGDLEDYVLKNKTRNQKLIAREKNNLATRGCGIELKEWDDLNNPSIKRREKQKGAIK